MSMRLPRSTSISMDMEKDDGCTSRPISPLSPLSGSMMSDDNKRSSPMQKLGFVKNKLAIISKEHHRFKFGPSSELSVLSPVQNSVGNPSPTGSPNGMFRKSVARSTTSFRDAGLSQQSIEPIKTAYWHELCKKLQFGDQKYLKGYTVNAPLAPFFKQLTKRCTGNPKMDLDKVHKRYILKLWLPDTIVFSKTDLPVWYYSTEDGFLVRTQNFTIERLMARFGWRSPHPTKIVGVVKRQRRYNNQTQIVTAERIEEVCTRLKSADCDMVLQRFVQPKGKHASVIRCVFHKDMPMRRYILVNRKHRSDIIFEEKQLQKTLDEQYLASFSNTEGIDVMPLKDSACIDINFIMNDMLTWIAVHAGLLFKEFAVDFIRHDDGVYWLIQVKAFQLIEPSLVRPLSKSISNSMKKRCGLCECYFPAADVPYDTTQKCINEIHEYCRRLGMPLSWNTNISVVRMDPTTYGFFHLCRQCFQFDKVIRDLFELQEDYGAIFRPGNELVFEMLQKTTAFPKFQSNVRLLRQPMDPPMYELFKEGLPEESPVTIMPRSHLLPNDRFIKRPMLGFRVLFYMKEIHEIGMLDTNADFSLKWNMFDVEQTCKVYVVQESHRADRMRELLRGRDGKLLRGRRKEQDEPIIDLNKLRTVRHVGRGSGSFRGSAVGMEKYCALMYALRATYIFAESREAIEVVCSQKMDISFNRTYDDVDEVLGTASVDFRRFLPVEGAREGTCKSLETVVTSRQTSWGYAKLQLTCGMDDGKIYDTSLLKLTEVGHGIWGPHPSYSCPVILSDPWMESLTMNLYQK